VPPDTSSRKGEVSPRKTLCCDIYIYEGRAGEIAIEKQRKRGALLQNTFLGNTACLENWKELSYSASRACALPHEKSYPLVRFSPLFLSSGIDPILGGDSNVEHDIFAVGSLKQWLLFLDARRKA
jgi:hypothetical protein